MISIEIRANKVLLYNQIRSKMLYLNTYINTYLDPTQGKCAFKWMEL